VTEAIECLARTMRVSLAAPNVTQHSIGTRENSLGECGDGRGTVVASDPRRLRGDPCGTRCIALCQPHARYGSRSIRGIPPSVSALDERRSVERIPSLSTDLGSEGQGLRPQGESSMDRSGQHCAPFGRLRRSVDVAAHIRDVRLHPREQEQGIVTMVRFDALLALPEEPISTVQFSQHAGRFRLCQHRADGGRAPIGRECPFLQCDSATRARIASSAYVVAFDLVPQTRDDGIERRAERCNLLPDGSHQASVSRRIAGRIGRARELQQRRDAIRSAAAHDLLTRDRFTGTHLQANDLQSEGRPPPIR